MGLVPSIVGLRRTLPSAPNRPHTAVPWAVALLGAILALHSATVTAAEPSRAAVVSATTSDSATANDTEGADAEGAPTPPAAPVPSRAEVERGIALGTAYLIEHCGADGRFDYVRHIDPSRKGDPKYNLLRHAGAIYALGMANELNSSVATRATMVQATAFLDRDFLHPVPADPDLLALWTIESRLGYRRPHPEPYAKLGGAGLTLVALCGVHRVDPQASPLERLQGLARFILFLQDEETGQFTCKYRLRRGADASWSSLYYPGEAMLGLLLLYEIDRDPRWLRGAAKGMAYLARERADWPMSKMPADHWALLATAKLLPKYPMLRDPPAPPEAILGHTRRIVELMLGQQVTKPDPMLQGCFREDGLTCPTAIRLEGLLAARTILPASEAALKQRIDSAADLGILFLLRSQVEAGPLKGGIPRGVVRLRHSRPGYVDQFNAQVDEIRIDYVQHALSAMIQYHESRFSR